MIAVMVEGKLVVMLEQDNLDKLRAGQSLAVCLQDEAKTELTITYTPNLAWVMKEMKAGRAFTEVIKESLK